MAAGYRRHLPAPVSGALGRGPGRRLGWVCRIAVALFARAWLGAGVVFALGTTGLFGVARDPLSGVYLVLLGLPWTAIAAPLPLGPLGPVIGVAAPGVNLAILVALCRLRHRRREGYLT